MERFAKTLERPDQILGYLVSEYEVSEPRAKEIIVKHKELVEAGITRASYIWYIGEEIAGAEGLEPKIEIDEEEYGASDPDE